MHPDDLPGVRERMASIGTEGIVTLEYRLRRADGEYEWVETTARRVGDEIQCSSRGVTERRAASAQLARRLAQQSAVARLGETALQRPDLNHLLEQAIAAVAETLDVEHVRIVEDLGDGTTHVRASVGSPADAASAIDVPIGSDAALGVLTVGGDRAFDERDLDFLQAVAHVLAGAIERLRAERQMRHDALHDSLTGLPNRSLLLDRLHHALARADARRRPRRAAVRRPRQPEGHQRLARPPRRRRAAEGDRAAPRRPAARQRHRRPVRRRRVRRRLRGHRRRRRRRCEIARRVVAAFEDPFIVAGEERFGSVSVGVVVTNPVVPRSADELLSDADAAMYRAKERGRGRFELFDAGLRDRITARLQLEADLRRALEGEGRLWVAYQPFYRLPGRDIAGVEALVRWEHPQRGNLSPAEFIPVAEESGLVVPLGARVLRAACEQVAQWQRETGYHALRLTVNVSARQMATPEFVDVVQQVLDDTGLHPDSLGLEITERLLLEETPATALTIELLQALGVRLLLDDFGTGYSSLRYLQRYPLDGLKVDRAFVMGLGEDGDGDGAIVEAIVGMARALGMGVIPEGVETEGQLDRLCALGCDHAQGFLLSRPLPAEQLESLLRSPV